MSLPEVNPNDWVVSDGAKIKPVLRGQPFMLNDGLVARLLG
jgi:hypothetical protein